MLTQIIFLMLIIIVIAAKHTKSIYYAYFHSWQSKSVLITEMAVKYYAT